MALGGQTHATSHLVHFQRDGSSRIVSNPRTLWRNVSTASVTLIKTNRSRADELDSNWSCNDWLDFVGLCCSTPELARLSRSVAHIVCSISSARRSTTSERDPSSSTLQHRSHTASQEDPLSPPEQHVLGLRAAWVSVGTMSSEIAADYQ
eukprot:SAG31_NODE_13_length_37961_cov_21.751307_4_plen_150_part_00